MGAYLTRRLGEDEPAADEGDGADRYVHVEGRSPAEVFDQQRADGWTGGHSEGANAIPE